MSPKPDQLARVSFFDHSSNPFPGKLPLNLTATRPETVFESAIYPLSINTRNARNYPPQIDSFLHAHPKKNSSVFRCRAQPDQGDWWNNSVVAVQQSGSCPSVSRSFRLKMSLQSTPDESKIGLIGKRCDFVSKTAPKSCPNCGTGIRL